jgi:chitinase
MPIALTAVLLALLAAGIAVALVTLVDTPESAPPPATVTVPAASTPATTPPATSVPTTTSPAATVPTTTSPATTTPRTSTPSDTATQGTFTIPGTRITLPATGGARGADAVR